MDKLLSHKIKIARTMRRLSMEQLVQRMGKATVSKMAISKIERGLMRPSTATLAAIAAACQVPVSYFYSAEVNIASMEFRFDKDTDSNTEKQVKALVEYFVHDYFMLEADNIDAVNFVNPMKPTIIRHYNDAEECAERLRRKWNIGCQPIFSVYELLENIGIRVLELDFGCRNIDGVSAFVNEDTPIIIINTCKNNTTERKRFTALHELAHLLFKFKPWSEAQYEAYLKKLPLLPYVVTEKTPDVEKLCNRFANAMLLPSQSLLRRIGTTRTNIDMQELISIRSKYGISIAATIHRLHDLRVIDDDYYHYYFEEVISKNFMEHGWGAFPIEEKADTAQLLKARMEKEIRNIINY